MPSLCQTESGVMIPLAALSPTEPSDFTANCFTLHNTVPSLQQTCHCYQIEPGDCLTRGHGNIIVATSIYLKAHPPMWKKKVTKKIHPIPQEPEVLK